MKLHMWIDLDKRTCHANESIFLELFPFVTLNKYLGEPSTFFQSAGELTLIKEQTLSQQNLKTTNYYSLVELF